MRLVALTPEIAQQAKNEWMSFVYNCEDLPEAQYERTVNWLESHATTNNADKQYEVLVLVNGDSAIHPTILAVLDVAHKLPNLSNHYTLKVMGISAAPHFDVRGKDTPEQNAFTRRAALANIASSIVTASIDMMFERGACQVKLYASNQISLQIFELVCGQLSSELLTKIGLDVDTHGNWLVIKPA